MSNQILLIYGGNSDEKEISVNSAFSILNQLGVDEATFKKHQDATHYFDIGNNRQVCWYNAGDNLWLVAQFLQNFKPDAIINVIHGGYGEDGRLQNILDMLKIPYTGPGMVASSLGMNKQLTKAVVSDLGIATTQGRLFSPDELKNTDYFKNSNKTMIIKPNNGGSSVNMQMYDPENPTEIKSDIYHENEMLLVEEFFTGTDVTVGVADGNPLAVTMIELSDETKFFDYEAKYINQAATHILPAPIPDAVAENLKSDAVKIYHALLCRGVVRIDFLINRQTNEYRFLEINTSPGMSKVSLVPEQLEFNQISMSQCIHGMLDNATFDL